ncbi:eCIS core domain-containing protein [Massilia rhizosphaerae]|uniref:eCIS core domain-containing protein n=1 Tax=Massilia rhizosphaerae TaxID=2784389 RepID=UPI0018DC1E56|nr:DUF4157 domain-containing protein [Massilia rhizosphaerae]
MQQAEKALNPAAETRQRQPAAGRTDAHATFADKRPEASAQDELLQLIAQSPRVDALGAMNESIQDSPRMVAQRRQLSGIFGGGAQQAPLQGRLGTLQRKEPDEEELRMKAAPAAPNRIGLPDGLKSGIESLSGMPMDHVRVHYNSSQPAQLNALAYAQGSDIHLGPGQEQHLPHEAWHVVQQAQGRVRPTTQMKDAVPVNDDQGLEREADVMGAKAASVQLEADTKPRPTPSRPGLRQGGSGSSIQRKDAKTKAKDRKIDLGEKAILGSKDKALVAPRGASLADDPEFEKRAVEFEKRLGHFCFNHPRANQAAGRLCAPILGYIKAKLARIEGDKAKRAEERRLYTALAGQATYAGAVAKSDKSADDETDLRGLVGPITAVIDSGNLRERLNLVDQFMRILGADFAAAHGDKYAEFRAIAEEAKLDLEALDERNKTLADKHPTERSLADHAPKDSALVERDTIRVITSDPRPFSDMCARDMRTAPLSERESQHQKIGKPKDKLKFTEGAKQFAINEAHGWVEQMRTLSLPLKAGPSGHTQVFMEANRFLGAAVSPFDIRLASIGHLLPINAHSLVEILDVAQHHGCPYEPGPLMYRQLLPMSTQELRVVGGGRFPDEKTDEELRRNVSAEQRANIPELNDLELAKHKQAQEARMAGALAEMGVEKGAGGRVSEVLKAKDGKGAQTRGAIERVLRNPIKTYVQREALNTADKSAISTEKADIEAAKKKIDEALGALGVKNLGKYPDAYERCVKHLQNSTLTTNLPTTALFSVLRGGYLNRAERTQGTADSNKIFNPDYGYPDYAYTRDQAERRLHHLPPMHPHFVPEDMQEAYDEVLESRIKGTKSEHAKGVYKKEEQGPVIKVTSETGEESYPLEDPRRPATEVFRGREYLKAVDEPSEPLSLPGDRPHSAALNPLGYRSGGAPSVAYGKSSLVWKHEVNKRSTYTGMDSKDYMVEGKALSRGGPPTGLNVRGVASFDHMARVLIHCDPGTLRAIVYKALDLQKDGVKAPAMHACGAALSYIEGQIFGQIDLSRDVEKIIIDEDDLDLWEEGLLKTDTIKTVAPKPKAETKRDLLAWAASLGVPIQFIRSGRNKADASGAGPHLTDVAEQWEGVVESTLTDMQARRWHAAAGALFAIAHGAEPTVKGGTWGTYKGVGLGRLKALRDRAEQMCKAREKQGPNVDKKKLLDGVAGLAHEAITEYLINASAVDHDYRADLQRLALQVVYWLGKCIVGILPHTVEETQSQEELGTREKASRRGPRPDGKPQVVVESSVSDQNSSSKKKGPTNPSSSIPSRLKPKEKQLNEQFAAPRGDRNLDVFDTGGGGDCGIHAVLGEFDGGTGQMRHANPDAMRVQLAEAIRAREDVHPAYYDLIADLLRQIYLKVIAGEALTTDENTAWREFRAIEGIEQRLHELLEAENQRYQRLGVERGRIAQAYLEGIAGESATFEPLRQFLVQEVLRSGAKSDAEARAVIGRANAGPARSAQLRALPYVYLRGLVEANLDGLARAGAEVPALQKLIESQRQYGHNVNAAVATFRPLVVEHAEQFLAAYSRCVLVPGYYLRDRDVMLLADIYGRQAVLYRQHDEHPGQYQVISGNPDAENAVHVFHSGAHYEHATLNGR